MPVPNTTPLGRRSLLRDDVYRAVRGAIVRGELSPGEKLVDVQLQRWLGVSRTPIREALLRLERNGLVSAVPGQSTVVAPYDAAAVRDSRVVAAELHSLAARLAVPNLAAEDLTWLTEANETLRQGVEAGDAEACVSADDAFHGVFIDRSANAVLAEQIDQVMPVLRRAEYLHFDSARALTSISHHEQIIAAAQAGDASGCAELTQQNWLALSESWPICQPRCPAVKQKRGSAPIDAENSNESLGPTPAD